MTRYTVDGEYVADSRRDRKLQRQRGRIRRVEDSAEMHERDIEQLIEAGECPWCNDYSGEHVGQHASATHPEKWNEYNE